jgi:hypothetical protein
MKKIILSIAIGLAMFSTAFAKHPVYVSSRAMSAFQKDFKKVSNVSWTETNEYVRATFIMNKETLFAYYDYQGNLIGLAHNILTTSLPENLQKDLKKYYGSYWVSDLVHVSNDNGDYYYIRLKNAEESIVLSTEGSDGWHVYKMPKQIN